LYCIVFQEIHDLINDPFEYCVFSEGQLMTSVWRSLMMKICLKSQMIVA